MKGNGVEMRSLTFRVSTLAVSSLAKCGQFSAGGLRERQEPVSAETRSR